MESMSFQLSWNLLMEKKTMEEIADETKIPLDTLIFVAEKLVLAGLLEVKH